MVSGAEEKKRGHAPTSTSTLSASYRAILQLKEVLNITFHLVHEIRVYI